MAKQYYNMTLLKIICVEEPDISYTSNKKLTIQETYLATYVEVDLGNFGICPIYKVYDLQKNFLGEYYGRDFKTLEEYRDKKLEELFA
jgi:uncharacterized protein YpmB